MFAWFDENPAMTLQDIKETKRYGRMDGCTHACTDNEKTVYPPQTKFAGGINMKKSSCLKPKGLEPSGPLPSLFKLCRLGQNGPAPGTWSALCKL